MPVLFTFNTPNLKRLASSAPKYGLGPKMYKWVTWPWPRPFQGWLVVSRLGLASYRPNFKFLKCTNWGSLKQLGVTQGHRQCCHLLPFDRTHTTSYSTLIETMLLSYTVFATQPGICQVDNFNHPHLNLAPPQGLTPVDFAEIFGTRKLESLGYHVVLFALPLMSRCEYSFFLMLPIPGQHDLTPSIKPKMHNISQQRQRRIEPRP